MYRTWLFYVLLVGIFSEGVTSQVVSEPSVSITPPVSNPLNTTPSSSNTPTTTSSIFAIAAPTTDLFTTTPPTSDPSTTTTTTTTPTSSFFITAPPTFDLFTTTPPTSDPPTTTSPSFSFLTTTATSPTSKFFTTPPPTFDLFTTTPPTSDPPTTTSPSFSFLTTTTTSPTSNFFTTPPPTFDLFTTTPPTSDPPTTSSPSFSFLTTTTTSPTSNFFTTVPPTFDYFFTTTPPTSNPLTTISTSSSFTTTAPTEELSTNTSPDFSSDTTTSQLTSSTSTTTILDVITSTSNVPSTISQSSIFTTVKVPTTSSIPSLVNTTTSSPPGILTSNVTTTTSTPITTTTYKNFTGVIVGAVVGSVGGVIVIGLLGFLIWKIVRRREWPLENKPPKRHTPEQFAEMFKMKERETQGFGTEFSALQCIGALQSRSISTHPKNATKNHPEAVFPYDNSLVKLSKDGNSSNGYINASFFPGQKFKKEFIAAQSPLRETVNDFWQMIWEQNVTTVIMFSSCEEAAPASGEVYWPSTESRLFGNVLVTYVKEKPSLDWIEREFTLTHVKKKDSFQVKQFQFTSWPVNSDLCEQELLINFVTQVVQHREQQPNKYPTLVHCRTGGSRCGILIALSRIVTQLKMDNSVDVYNTVKDLFLCRPSMIQTKEEYLFLHRCTLDIIRARYRRPSDAGYAEPVGNNIYYNDVEYEKVLKHYNSRASDYETLYDSPD